MSIPSPRRRQRRGGPRRRHRGSASPLPAQFFTVDGYAPFAAQMLLLRYWKQHGQPRVLQTVPGLPMNEVFIEARGREAFRVGAHRVPLERYRR